MFKPSIDIITIKTKANIPCVYTGLCFPGNVFKTGAGQVISGLVFLSTTLTERLLGLHTQSPLDRCTYYGTDSGIPPLQVSIHIRNGNKEINQGRRSGWW